MILTGNVSIIFFVKNIFYKLTDLNCPRKFRDKEYSAEQKLPVAGFERGRRERNFWVAYWKGEHLDGDENSAAVKCDTRLVSKTLSDTL